MNARIDRVALLSWQVGGLAAVDLAGRAAGLILALLITRRLGPIGLGQYATALTVAGLLRGVADLGIDPLITRNVANGDRAYTDIVATRTSIGVMVAFGLLVVHWLVTSELTNAIALAGLAIPCELLAKSCRSIAVGEGQTKRLVVSEVVARGLGTASAIGVLGLGYGVSGVLVSRLLSAIVQAGGASLAVHRCNVFAFGIDWCAIGRSIPFTFSALLGMAYVRGDILLLAAIRGPGEVGWYSAAYRLLDSVLILASAFAAGALRDLARPSSSATASAYVILAGLVGGAIAVAGWLAAPWLVRGFGAANASTILSAWQILAVGIPFAFVGAVGADLVVARDRQGWLPLLYGAALGLNLLANLIVIPIDGLVGAAWTTNLTEAVLAVLLLVVAGQATRATGRLDRFVSGRRGGYS
jgi:O-antigen/teichoic acid export membrane protein